MTGNIALVTMGLAWIGVFLYTSLTFGTPIVAGVLALVLQGLVFLLILTISEILRE